MLVEIKLLGSLGQRFGRKYRLDVDTPAEAFRALAAQLDGFLDYLYEAAKSGVGWQIVDDDPLGMLVDGLDLRIKTNRLIIAPRIDMGDGVSRLVAGLALVAFSFLVPGGFLLSAATFGAVGASLVISGLTELLTPKPENKKADSQTIELAAARGYQGLAVPILYGKVYINDLIPVSAAVYAGDIPLGADGEGSINWGGGLTPQVDPYPALTKVLLHFDNNLIDAKNNASPTGVGIAYSSVEKVFGSYSVRLSGIASGSYINFPASTAVLQIGGSSATFEGQLYIDSPTPSDPLNESTLIGCYDPVPGLGYYWLYDHNAQEFRFVSDSFTANWLYALPLLPAFQHLALCVDTMAQAVDCFVDGISLGSIAYLGTLGNPTVNFRIGSRLGLPDGKGLKGYVDEFRLSIGIARYSATFVPPTSSFANN